MPDVDAARGPIQHYIVQTTALDAAVHVLQQLPYGQIAATMALLDRGTQPVFANDAVRELNDQQRKLLDLADVVGDTVKQLDAWVSQWPDWSSENHSVREISDRLADAFKIATFRDAERNLTLTQPPQGSGARDSAPRETVVEPAQKELQNA